MDSPLAITVQRRFALLLGLAACWLCPIWLDPTPTVPPLLWGAVCLGWLLCLHQPLQLRPRAGLMILLALLGGMIAWRSTSLPNTLAALLCIAGIGLAAHLARSLHGQGLVSLIAWGWLLAGLVSAALALAQYLGATPEPAGTAFGFLRQRNQLATLCNLALAALLYLVHGQRQLDLPKVPWSRISAALCAAFLCAALAATCSRTGLLQLTFLILATGALALRARGMRRHELLAAALTLGTAYWLAAWLLPPLAGSTETVMTRVFGVAHDAASGGTAALELQLQDSRRVLWHNTVLLIEQSPWLGVGWRELAYALNTTDFGVAARFPVQADHSHNIVLQLAVELGLAFTALWCALVMVWLYRRWSGRTRAPQHLLAWAVLAVLGIHSMLEYPLWYAPFQIALGLALGLLDADEVGREPWIPAFAGMTIGAGMRMGARTTLEAGMMRAWAWAWAWAGMRMAATRWLGAALILFCAYAAFDYHRVSQLFRPADQRFALYQTNTLAKAEGSWLFASQVRFAKLLTTPVTESNAKDMWALGQQVIHFSPEPRVLKVLIAAGEWLAPSDAQIAAEIAVLKRQLLLIER
jgi:O-antigen ligase